MGPEERAAFEQAVIDECIQVGIKLRVAAPGFLLQDSLWLTVDSGLLAVDDAALRVAFVGATDINTISFEYSERASARMIASMF